MKAIQIKGMPAVTEKALYDVIKARAAWETIDEMDKATKSEILSKNDFRTDDTDQRITKVNSDFRMSDDDFLKYCGLVYSRNCEKGVDSGGAELTFWPAHKAVYDAEDAYIDIVTADIPEYTPEVVKTLKTSPKQREKFFAIFGL